MQKSARRRAREFALQGLYQWLLSQEDLGVVSAHIRATPGFDKADAKHFDSLLYNTKCSKADYRAANKIWDKFNCKTLMDYHNLYLTVDVLFIRFSLLFKISLLL